MDGGTATRVDEPLHLAPVLVAKPWGGRRLQRFGRELPEGELIGESWDVADLDPRSTPVSDPATRVTAGPFRGLTLQELIALDRDGLLGDAPDLDGRFPLLVKLLDAREHLSVQVHPPKEAVSGYPAATSKTESWVVLDAQPGAELLIGVREDVDMGMLTDAAGTSKLIPLLRRCPAHPGDVFHVPAGTVHALTAGIVVAEVQTPADTSLRVYDWGEEYDRAPRDLHLEAALRSIDLAWEHNIRPAPLPELGTRGVLVDTPSYRLARYGLAAGASREITAGEMRVVVAIEGRLTGDGFRWPLRPGGSVVLPAAWQGRLRASGPDPSSPAVTWLEATVPSR